VRHRKSKTAVALTAAGFGLMLMTPTAASADSGPVQVPDTTVLLSSTAQQADLGYSTESVSATYYDDNGNVIASTPQSTSPADSTGLTTGDEPDPGDSLQNLPDDSTVTEPAYITAESAMQGMINCSQGKVCGSPTYKGCATWYVTLTHYDDFGHTMFKLHEDVFFCWKAKHICTCPQALRVSQYLTNTDPVIEDNGNTQNEEYYYQYWDGKSNSGHASKMKRSITYSVGGWDYNHIYPWIHEYVHGDGTMYFHAGT